MAKVLKKIFDPTIDEVVQNFTIHSWHVSQSVDAFTGADDYDITLSGSLIVTGSVAIHTLPNSPQNGVVLYDDVSGLLYYTASSAFAVNNFYTSSITQSFTSSVVNNNINQSTVNQTIISSSVNTPAPSNNYIQYNSASAFGASADFQFIYSLSSLQQGNTTLTQGQYSHAEGKATNAVGISSHAEGDTTTSQGDWSHAEGRQTNASGSYSHAEGNFNVASGYASHTEGTFTQATAQYSHAEGYRSLANGDASHAEGQSTTSSGAYSHAEGNLSYALGIYSHAEGTNTYARGLASHAEGFFTLAQGLYSHAEGAGTLALGWNSHAEGWLTTSSANYSHAEGYWTIAEGLHQHVQGQFNQTSSAQSAFIVGNGTSNTSRSNLIFASGSIVQITGSLGVSSTLVTSGSRVRKYRTITLTNADYSLNPTPSIQSDDDIVLIIDNTTSPSGAGEGNLSITNFLNSSAGRCVEIVKIKDGTGGGIIILNSTMAGNVLYLNDSTQANGRKTICPSVANSITLMSLGTPTSGSAWGTGY